MESLKRQVKFQVLDWKKAFLVFWSVVFAVNAIMYFLASIDENLSYGVSMSEVKFDGGSEIITEYMNGAAGNLIPIGIFMIVYSIVMYYETFSTAISFSSTRKDFYLGNIISSALICFSMALIEGILLKVDKYIVKAIGRLPINNILYFDLGKDNILFIVIMLFFLTFVFTSFFNLVGVLFYKVGYKFWIVIAAVVIIIGNFSILRRRIADFSVYFFKYDNFILFFIKIVITAFALYAAGWGVARRLSVKNK